MTTSSSAKFKPKAAPALSPAPAPNLVVIELFIFPANPFFSTMRGR